MKRKLTLLHTKVLVRRLESKSTTKGGIVLPDTAKEENPEGEIIALGEGIGPGHLLQVGQTVLFAPYAGTDIKIGGVGVMLMDESDILAIFN